MTTIKAIGIIVSALCVECYFNSHICLYWVILRTFDLGMWHTVPRFFCVKCSFGIGGQKKLRPIDEFRAYSMENQNTQNGKPDNLLVWSILSTVLCCIPLGIVAILQSNKVDTLWAAGDHAGAQEAAKQAKLFCLIALGCGVVGYIIAFVVSFIAEII